MAYKIDEIEGIGPSYGQRLNDAGIKNTDHLLDLCCTPTGRKHVASKTGLTEKQILEWTNMADLMRVSGVGRQFAELLEASGVDTIKELRNRNAENLAKAIQAINDERRLARATPSVSMVSNWIAQAKKTDPKISY
jgi:predicted flap endonuclease-1-like 5' DNA nuclease